MTRHTWQSWRERYKKNADRLDKHIQAIVELTKPSQGGQGQYGYVRQVEKVKRVRKKRPVKRQGSAEAETSGVYNEEPTSDLGVVDMAVFPVPGQNVLSQNDPLPVPVRRSPAEEEMDDTEDDPEWAIRIGNAPPPAWAKRKASNEHPGASPSKRPRETYVCLRLSDLFALLTISLGIPKCISLTKVFSRLLMILGSRL